MYNDKKEITIEAVVEYDFNLDEKEKQIIDLKGVKSLEIVKK